MILLTIACKIILILTQKSGLYDDVPNYLEMCLLVVMGSLNVKLGTGQYGHDFKDIVVEISVTFGTLFLNW